MEDASAMLVIHTGLSILGVLLGVPAMLRLLFNQPLSAIWTDSFLVVAILATLTGFLLPFSAITPAVAVGIVSTVIFAVMLLARFRFDLAGHAAWIYAAGMVASLYLLVFVGIVQSFGKLDFLHQLAPTQTELPFVVIQLIVLSDFVMLGIWSIRKFWPVKVAAA